MGRAYQQIAMSRQVAGDAGFLSPTPVDSLSIHFTFGHHPVEVMKCVRQLEQVDSHRCIGHSACRPAPRAREDSLN